MLNLEQIKEIIPHREPMIMIDEVIELDTEKGATAIKRLTGDEDYFAGHFPKNPVMPGVLILEALAQTGAVSLLSRPEFKGKTVYFAGIDKAKFRRKVVPKETLTLKVQLVRLRGSIGIAEGVAYVGEEKAASATLTFAIG